MFWAGTTQEPIARSIVFEYDLHGRFMHSYITKAPVLSYRLGMGMRHNIRKGNYQMKGLHRVDLWIYRLINQGLTRVNWRQQGAM